MISKLQLFQILSPASMEDAQYCGAAPSGHILRARVPVTEGFAGLGFGGIPDSSERTVYDTTISN